MIDAQHDVWVLRVWFRALAEEWDLDATLVAMACGCDPKEIGTDLVPMSQSPDVLNRVRLLLTIRDLLPTVMPDVREVPVWLHGILGDGGETPFAFLCGGIANQHAMRAALLALTR